MPKKICYLCGRSEDRVSRLIMGKYGCICGDCAVEVNNRLNEGNSTKPDNNMPAKPFTPSHLFKHLNEYVIGQEEAKKALSVAVYNHYKRINCNQPDSDSDVEIQKSNILMIGATGSGKTYLAQSLAKFLDVPFTIADATTLTQTGYVGDDVENILLRLLENADYDVKKAERGIVYIDEIDKLARKGENSSITRDVSGEGVQQGLLKILEGTVSRVPMSGGRKHPLAECVNMDTSNILFICGGAFDGLDSLLRKKDKTVGFNADISDNEPSFDYADVSPHDLVKYGMMPELIGRLPVIAALKPLKEADLLRILTEPKNALIKQYKKLLSADNVNLEFADSALKKIAAVAVERETGARGLRSIMEKAMQDIMFTVPDMENVSEVIITEGVIDGSESPTVHSRQNTAQIVA